MSNKNNDYYDRLVWIEIKNEAKRKRAELERTHTPAQIAEIDRKSKEAENESYDY